MILLCATMNTVLEVQASGEDEEAAVCAMEWFFQSDSEEDVQDLVFKTVPPDPPRNPS